MPTLHRPDTELHYSDYGCGPAVLLLHGLGSHGGDWLFQTEALAPHYRVITLDLRGHGQSRAVSEVTIEEMAEDVWALSEVLKLDSLHLVGFSLGGMVALQFALGHPQRLRSLCLINSGPYAAASRSRRYRELLLRTAVVRFMGMPRLAAVIASRLFPEPGQESLARQLTAHMGEMSPRSYLACMRALLRWDVSAHLAQIHTPTLILASDQDYTSPEFKQHYAASMQRAQVRIVSHSRHAMPLDQPEAVNAHLLRFLAEREKALSHQETITTTPRGTVYETAL